MKAYNNKQYLHFLRDSEDILLMCVLNDRGQQAFGRRNGNRYINTLRHNKQIRLKLWRGAIITCNSLTESFCHVALASGTSRSASASARMMKSFTLTLIFSFSI